MSFDKFLFAFESRDLSQADKSIIWVSSFPSWVMGSRTLNYTKKSYLALGTLGNLAKLVFWSISSCKLSFSQYFWWEVNLRGLRPFILQNSGLTCGKTWKEVLPSITCLWERRHSLILLSAWDRSRDSTAKRNLSKCNWGRFVLRVMIHDLPM